MRMLGRRLAGAIVAVVLAHTLPAAAVAQDKVKVGVVPVATSLPYFVALDRGYFKEQKIEVETVRLIGGPPTAAALNAHQNDAASVHVTLEGMNTTIKTPGAAVYISLNSQSETYPMEQFVVRKGFQAKSIKDLKGAKILSAPGPGNVLMAKAALEANGLKEGDYRLEQLDTAQHLGALKAGTFDAGYTLEPTATMMRQQGIAETLETGVIARTVLGDPKADAFVGGGVISTRFMTERPEVAKRYAAAWLKAVADIRKDPESARRHLLKNTLVPESAINDIPMPGFFAVAQLDDKSIAQFQRFIDFSMKLINAPETVDVRKYLKTY